MKRTLSLLLAALMLCGSLAACADNRDTTTDTTAAPSADTTPTPETAPTHDAEGYLLDALPADLNFGGEEIGILTWSDVEQPEFEILEVTGEVVNDAIFKRNETVQKRLNVTFNWLGVKGNASNGDTYLKAAQNSYNAGDGAYDIYASYSRTAANCAVNGLCYNLSNVDYLDFEKPWWPERLLDTVTMGDKLYFISGDISTNVLHFMYGVYYNKDMFKNYQLPDPIEMVQNGTWTIDRMIELTQNMYADLNNNGVSDSPDQFGMATLDFHMDALYTGSDLVLVEQDEENMLIMSPDYTSEKTMSLVDKLGAWVKTEDFHKGENNGTYEDSFEAGNTLMCLNRCYLATRRLRDVSFSYGIVPVPKYDEAQNGYITVMGNPFTLYCITRDCDDPNRAAAVLEAMASTAYRTTTPAIFEINMKVKYSEDNVDAQMFDLIREGVVFDLGRLFGIALNHPIDKLSDVIWSSGSWAAPAKAYTKMMNSGIKKLVEKLQAIE